jgi:hypothetical protein
MRWAALLVGIAFAAGVLWFAGEKHYENCVNSADDRLTGPEWVVVGSDQERQRDARLSQLRRGCSRLPF